MVAEDMIYSCPLVQASREGNLDEVERIMKDPNDQLNAVNYAFYEAGLNGHINVMKYLFTSWEPRVFCFAYIDVAISGSEKGDLKVVKCIIELANQVAARDIIFSTYERWLCKACYYGHLEVVQYLVEYFDIDISYIQQYIKLHPNLAGLIQ
jgi:hypothetical protein